MTATAQPRTRPADCYQASPAVRAQTIADARAMLGWLEDHPDIPMRAWGFEYQADPGGREAVDDLALVMGVTAEHTTSSHRAVKRFGLAAYVAYAANLDEAS